MNDRNDTLLILARGGMELSWRYAWAVFLTQIAIQRSFPFSTALTALCLSAVLTRLPKGRRWRLFQRLSIQFVGLLALSAAVFHSIQYRAFPFFSPGWVLDLLLGPKTMSRWSVLLLLVFCLWLIWRGGNILVTSPRLYSPVCLHFDKGLGLLFLLLIVKAFVASRAGIYLPGPTIGFLTISYFVFGLASIAVARNQGSVQKSFLSGHHGMGVTLGVAVMVTLLCGGTTFLVYPYLTGAADSTLSALKDTARPALPVLIDILRFLFRPKHLIPMTDNPHPAAPLLPVPGTRAGGRWEALQSILMAGLVGILGMVVLAALAWFAVYIVRRLLERDQKDFSRLSVTGLMSAFLRWLAQLPLNAWHGVTSVLKGIDCAKTAYVRMLRWGRRSGVLPIASETPTEYGKRLATGFPGLGAEITLIVEAFNLEAYGRAAIDGQLLSRLKGAQRRMKRLEHWPSRLKGWLST